MAKTLKQKQEKRERVYPSDFGSHLSMIDKEASEGLPEHLVALRDGEGLYITERNRLDSGLADANRYGSVAARQISTQRQDANNAEIRQNPQ